MTASRTIKFDDHILPAKWYNGFGGAVSRILSAPARAGGENHLSQQPIPGIRCTFAQLGAGRSRIPYLALHRTGFSVPRCLRFARCALTAPFHPYPRTCARGRFNFLWHFPSKSLPAFRPRVSGNRVPGYAASCPVVFGLSSPSRSRERFSAPPKPGLTYPRRRVISRGEVRYVRARTGRSRATTP